MPKYKRIIVRMLGLFLLLGCVPLAIYTGKYIGDDILLTAIYVPIYLSWYIAGLYGVAKHLPLTQEEQYIIDKEYEEGLVEELEEMGYTVLSPKTNTDAI